MSKSVQIRLYHGTTVSSDTVHPRRNKKTFTMVGNRKRGLAWSRRRAGRVAGRQYCKQKVTVIVVFENCCENLANLASCTVIYIVKTANCGKLC
jgi:hypothetical protein